MSRNGELPKGWVRTCVGDVYKIVGGGTPSTKIESFWEGTIPWITSADILSPKNIKHRKTISLEAVEKSTTNIVPKNTIIVVTRVGLGKVGLAPQEICFSQDAQGLIEEKNQIFPDYALYYLSQAVQVFKYKNRGTTISGVTTKQLKQLEFIFPPFQEQRRIVAKIEELFSSLDAGVAALERAKANLKRYRASVLKAAVEGKLTEQWRKEHPPTETASRLLERILHERHRKWEEEQLAKYDAQGKTPPKGWKEKYREPAKPDTRDLPELPEGWCWASLDQLGETTTGFTPSTAIPEFFGGGIPFFKPTDLDAGYFLRDYRESLTEQGAQVGRLLPALSILVTCIGATIGKTGLARVSCATNQQINSVTVVKGLVSPHYVFWFLTSPFGQGQIVGNSSATTLPILNKSRFEALPIPLPPIEKQLAFVEAIEDQYSIVEHLETELDAKLKNAQTLRQSILHRAFTGRLVPQDPNDEPAEILLERIRAEKAAQSHTKAPRKAHIRSRHT